MANALSIWIQASRPRTLVISISPVLMGVTLALSQGTLNFVTFLLTLAFGLSIQIGTNLANDYFDFIKGADTAERKGPLRVTQAGLVSKEAIKRAFILAFSCAALSSFYLITQGGFAIAALAALSILLGVIYTGGPYPLAYLGLGDLFALIFFGPVAVCGTYFLQTHTLSMEAFIVSFIPGLFAAAVITVNNLRDVEEDRLANKKTLVVRLGKSYAKFQYLFCILTALTLPLLLRKTHPFVVLTPLVILPAIPLIRAIFKNKDPLVFNLILAKTAQLLLIYTLIFCISWML